MLWWVVAVIFLVVVVVIIAAMPGEQLARQPEPTHGCCVEKYCSVQRQTPAIGPTLIVTLL